MTIDFRLYRDAFGKLVFTRAGGSEYLDVEPARSFPITAPRQGISLMNREGHELAWIPCLDELPEDLRRIVEDELETREFMPEVKRVRHVSGYATPCTWFVETDRGETSFVLKAEEDIRRLAAPSLLIVDQRGIQFLIRNPATLDDSSRKILDRFL